MDGHLGRCGPLFLICITLLGLTAAADLLDAQLGDTGPCKRECHLRYGEGSTAEEAVLVACYRGCRLFSICHFVDANAELNATRAECESDHAENQGWIPKNSTCGVPNVPIIESLRKIHKHTNLLAGRPILSGTNSISEPQAKYVTEFVQQNIQKALENVSCVEAYNKGEEQYGCTTGCRNQFPVVDRRKEKTFELKTSSSFSVFDLVSSFCSDIVNSAQSFISSTWTFYLQADDGKVVVFQSQPEIEYPVDEELASRSDVTEKTWTPPKLNTLKPHTGVREKKEKFTSKDVKMKHKLPHLETSQQQEHDFLGCMSKRSGLPRWILAACLFLSIMVMLWLSCASLVTAPDQHVKTQPLTPLSINGDKEYLNDVKKPPPFSLQSVIAVTVSPEEDNEEAGSLPVKVELDKTIV